MPLVLGGARRRRGGMHSGARRRAPARAGRSVRPRSHCPQLYCRLHPVRPPGRLQRTRGCCGRGLGRSPALPAIPPLLAGQPQPRAAQRRPRLAAPPPAAAAAAAGGMEQEAGRFRLGAFLGRGASGDVYEGIDTDTGLHSCGPSVVSRWHRMRQRNNSAAPGSLRTACTPHSGPPLSTCHRPARGGQVRGLPSLPLHRRAGGGAGGGSAAVQPAPPLHRAPVGGEGWG